MDNLLDRAGHHLPNPRVSSVERIWVAKLDQGPQARLAASPIFDTARANDVSNKLFEKAGSPA